MRWTFKATRATVGPVGIERRPGDGELARRIVRAMEDHSLLYSLREFPERYTVASAERARRELGVIICDADISPRLEEIARAMQAAFRDFEDVLGRVPEQDRPLVLWRLVGQLRAMVGPLIGELSSEYGVSVNDDLAASVPNPNDFFFQRFPAEQ